MMSICLRIYLCVYESYANERLRKLKKGFKYFRNMVYTEYQRITHNEKKEENKKTITHRIRATCISNSGKVREHNEDNFCFRKYVMPMKHQSLEEPYEFEVEIEDYVRMGLFDGMGGESAGEVASYVAASKFLELEDEIIPTGINLNKLCNELNSCVCEAGKIGKYNQIGTTASFMVFEPSQVWICNLGDSPIYRYRDKKLVLLSQMHTNQKILERMGITNRKPGLTQFLGISDVDFRVEPYITVKDLMESDIYLMCSDGLTDMVSEEEIANVLQLEWDIKEKQKKLLDMALEAGGTDNITIILATIGGI